MGSLPPPGLMMEMEEGEEEEEERRGRATEGREGNDVNGAHLLTMDDRNMV